jgi:hypothetical protein
MKKQLLILLLLCLNILLFAHESSQGLKAGQWDLGLNWEPFEGGGFDFGMGKTTDGNYETNAIFFKPINFYNPGAEDIEHVEYGVFDWLSVGARTGLTRTLVWGFRDGYWFWQGSAYVRANILQNPKFTINYITEFWAYPIYSTEHRPLYGDGYNYLYNTLSFNYSILSLPKDKISLWTYADLKLSDCFLQNGYTDAFKELIANQYGMTVDELNSSISYYPADNRLSLGLGLDFTWQHFNVNLGVGIPLYEWAYYDNSIINATRFGNSILDYLNLIECTWRYRF